MAEPENMKGRKIILAKSEQYARWAQVMQYQLVEADCWNAVTGTVLPVTKTEGKDKASEEEERQKTASKAMRIILTHVSDEQHQLLLDVGSPKAMWDRLREIHTRPSAERLFNALINMISYDKLEGMTIEQRAARLKRLNHEVGQMDAGMILKDPQLVVLLVKGLPKKYETRVKIIMTMGQWGNLDNVVRQLKGEEEESEGLGTAANPIEVMAARENYIRIDGNCHNCGMRGHMARDCRQPRRDFQRESLEQPQGRNTRSQSDGRGRDSGGRNGRGRDSKGRDERARDGRGRDSRTGGKGPRKNLGRNYVRLAENPESDEDPGDSEESGSDFAGMVYTPPTAGIGGRDDWIVDSGATRHVTWNRDLFSQYEQAREGDYLYVANGQTAKIHGRGEVIIRFPGKERVHTATIADVLHVPNMTVNLLSVSAMAKKGIRTVAEGDRMVLSKNGKIVAKAKLRGSTYLLEAVAPETVLLAASGPGLGRLERPDEADGSQELALATANPVADATVWHRRLGHISPSVVRKAVRTGRIQGDLPIADGSTCECCITAKLEKTIRKTAEQRTTKKLELVHMDICGPVTPADHWGARYLLTLTDDFTRKAWVYGLVTRDKTRDVFADWRQEAEKESGEVLKALRSDNAKEFISQHMEQQLQKQGVRQELTVPYNPHMNGVAERLNKTLFSRMRAMLADAELPLEFWVMAAQTATYLHNRMPQGNRKTIPEEEWTGRPVKLDNLRAFGCTAYVHIPKEQRKKLDQTAWKGIMVGYSRSIYKIWNPLTKTIYPAISVQFDEYAVGAAARNAARKALVEQEEVDLEEPVSQTPSQQAGGEIPAQAEQEQQQLPSLSTRVEPPTIPAPEPPAKASIPPATSPPTAPTKGRGQKAKEVPKATTPATLRQGETPQTQPHSNGRPEAGKEVVGEKGQVPPRARPELATEAPENKLAGAPQNETSRRSARIGASTYRKKTKEGAYAVTLEEAAIPQTYQEAINDPQRGWDWQQAIEAELQSLLAFNTWQLKDLPDGQNLVGSKWVFDIKRNPDGSIRRYKARLVAQGFSQRAGIDFQETFSPTVKYDSIRLLLALAANEDLEIHQMDVENAYLASDLKEVVYMRPPKGFDAGGKVCRLVKSLYGLRQSGRTWNEKITAFFISKGFQQLTADQGVLTRGGFLHGVTVSIYVDDFLIFGRRLSDIKTVKRELAKEFKMKDLGEVEYVLNIHVKRDRGNRLLAISQPLYTRKVLERFGMADSHPVVTPMEADTPKALDLAYTEAKRAGSGVDQQRYQEAIGSLMHLSISTRPDISFAVGKLSRHCQYPTEDHWKAVKRVLRYLAGTLRTGIQYGIGRPGGRETLVGYADSSYSDDQVDRRSTMAHAICLNGGAIAWSSRKTATVTLSTTEAEYMALSPAAKQMIWTNRVLQQLGLSQNQPVPLELRGDNLSSHQLAKNPEFHARTKHIDTIHHFVREQVAKKTIKLTYIATKKMLADGLTKPLGRQDAEAKFRGLGVVDVGFVGQPYRAA